MEYVVFYKNVFLYFMELYDNVSTPKYMYKIIFKRKYV